MPRKQVLKQYRSYKRRSTNVIVGSFTIFSGSGSGEIRQSKLFVYTAVCEKVGLEEDDDRRNPFFVIILYHTALLHQLLHKPPYYLYHIKMLYERQKRISRPPPNH
ncbi:hypothetical protein N7467_005429 [Penicillium canescens]|nr:hypothetical protein N7467_005429 [Penicillium canescens]